MTVAAAAVKSVMPAGTFVGRVQAVNTVNLVSRVEGFLQKRAFTEGQEVKTGDLLFVIEQDTYQAAVDQAQAQLASAQATERNAAIALQRSQELVKTNAVAQATVDQNLANQGTAAAAVRGAQAALEQANINLAFTEIKAPIDGRIGMANVSVGNFVNQTTGTLATIVSQPSEVPDRGPEDDYDGEREQAADDRHHDDIEIALAMGRIADREQRHHGTVVRQAVQRARADHRNPMQKPGVDTLLMRDLEIGRAQRVKRNRESA